MHPYLPLADGSTLTYGLNRVKGYWHQESMHFDVTERTHYVGPNATQIMLQTHMPLAFEFIAQTTCGDGQPIAYHKDRALLKSKWRHANGHEYIGESGGKNPGTNPMLEIPPIPLLHVYPVAGTQFSGTSTITSSGNTPDAQFEFPWKSGCIHVGQPWGSWPDTIRMALLENPEHPNRQGYNQIFARDVGEVHYWKGTIKADWTCDDGWEWYTIGA